MFDPTGRTCITYNGEIYNYQALRKTLEDKGYPFKTRTDTEVILNAYLEFGAECVHHLKGIFTFFIWDAHKKEGLIARDHLGVKPLYYSEHDGDFVFASELKALLQVPGMRRDLDANAMADYLTYLWAPAPQSPFKSIKKVPPGTAFTVREGKIVKKWRYYKPEFREDRTISEDEAIELVRDAIRRAVRRQLVADVEVGAFLSGGLDSSTVCAFAQQEMKDHQLKVFTIGSDAADNEAEGRTEDLPYARRVAEHLGLDLQAIPVEANMFDHLSETMYQMDEPAADPSAISTRFICSLARERGIKVLLGGAGGDELFAGYPRHFPIWAEQFWAFLPTQVRRAIGGAAAGLRHNTPTKRRISRALRFAGHDQDERILGYQRWLSRSMAGNLLAEPLQAELQAENRADLMLATLADQPEGTHRLNRALAIELGHYLPDHNLNYTDKMSMAEGIEVRVPLLDLDLVALAGRLPVAFKQRGRTSKYILKRAMEGILPHDVIYRPKTGFGVPIRSWIKGIYAEQIDAQLSPERLSAAGIFDPTAVRRLIETNRRGDMDLSYVVLSILCIQTWFDQFGKSS